MLRLKNMEIWKRLSLGFGSLGLTLLVVAAIGWWGMDKLAQGRNAVLLEAHKSNVTHEMIDTLSQINLATWNLIAEEVRKLAERSGVSAKDIAQHIQAAREAVGKGTSTVETTAQLLKQIRASLEQFAAQTRQVTVATIEQSKAGAEVARRVEQGVQESIATASATAQMSATTNEIARTASDLARVGEKLQSLVLRFSL